MSEARTSLMDDSVTDSSFRNATRDAIATSPGSGEVWVRVPFVLFCLCNIVVM